MIDVAGRPVEGRPIPNDARHRHFGGGQTGTKVTPSPGTHTLRLELADTHHVPFYPPVTLKIITVRVR